jgi:hypothetical protein
MAWRRSFRGGRRRPPARRCALLGEDRTAGVAEVRVEVREPPVLSSAAEFPLLPSRSPVGAGERERVVPAADLAASRA